MMRRFLVIAAVAMLVTWCAAPAESAPARPQVPRVKAGYESLTMTFAKKPPKGAHYRLTWTQGGRTKTVKAKGKKRTIKHLTNGTQYSFKVRTVKGRSVSAARGFSRWTTSRSLGPIADASISLTPVPDGVTATWGRVKYAKGYWVAWTPQGTEPPKSPYACSLANYCQRQWVRGTTVTLSAAQLSMPEGSSFQFRAGSAFGNTVRFRIFAINGQKYKAAPSTAYRYGGTPSDGWLSTRYSSMPAPLPPAGGTTVKISSFNILAASAIGSGAGAWGNRRAKVIAQMNATGASIIGLQEASHGPVGVVSGASQVQDLAAAAAPEWAAVDTGLWSDIDQNGFPANLGNDSSQGARIFYRPSVWDLQASGAFLTGDLSKSAWYHEPDSLLLLRHVSWARFQMPNQPDVQMCVVSVHLRTNGGDSNAARAVAAAQRAVESAQIRAMIDSPDTTFGHECYGLPTAVMGDFNAAQTHQPNSNKPVTDFIKYSGFVDTKNAAKRVDVNWSGTGAWNGEHDQYGSQIDYVLTRGMGGAVEFRVNRPAPSASGSDHFPVTATVQVPSTLQ